MTHVYAVSNQKGGVAKTTSCMSLGACMAEQGRRTLLVDLDPQAHLTMAAGLNPGELPCTLVDLLAGEDPQALDTPVIQPTALPGLDILPTDVRLNDLERKLYNQPGYEQALSRALAPWQASYDSILLDCPPSMGTLTLIALTAANTTLIPVQCEYFATQGLMQLLEIIQAVQARTNPVLDYFLFATLFDGRNLVSRRVLEQLRNHFPETMLETVIGMDTRLRECSMTGEPVITYAPKTRASLQYRSLAGELISRGEAISRSEKEGTIL